jgi:membrane protease YdiL (CAAX protease family)
MAPNPIRLSTVIGALVLVVLIETVAARLAPLFGWTSPALLAIVRALQITGMVGVVGYQANGLNAIGGAIMQWPRGLKIGAGWSLGMAVAAAAGMAFLRLTGHDPLALIRAPLPDAPSALVWFLIAGCLLGPVAEEICFRGILYTYFRRWGVAAALGVTTALFVALHAPQGLPLVQIAGGLVFALAYETSRNLMAPIVVHVAGNSAIFFLSYIFR